MHRAALVLALLPGCHLLFGHTPGGAAPEARAVDGARSDGQRDGAQPGEALPPADSRAELPPPPPRDAAGEPLPPKPDATPPKLDKAPPKPDLPCVPALETCNGHDDNCDGAVDGNDPKAHQSCGLGKYCADWTCATGCWADSGCSGGLTCAADHTCKCGGLWTCGPGFLCDQGTCKCGGLICGAKETCLGGACTCGSTSSTKGPACPVDTCNGASCSTACVTGVEKKLPDTLKPELVACQWAGGTQCAAASECNQAQGWRPCTFAEIQIRFPAIPPAAFQEAWIAGCVQVSFSTVLSPSLCVCSGPCGGFALTHRVCNQPANLSTNCEQSPLATSATCHDVFDSGGWQAGYFMPRMTQAALNRVLCCWP